VFSSTWVGAPCSASGLGGRPAAAVLVQRPSLGGVRPRAVLIGELY